MPPSDLPQAGILISHWNDDGSLSHILLANHGITESTARLIHNLVGDISVALLTMTRFPLPFFLGGTINLGIDAALAASKILRPKVLVPTHNENKIARGIISRIANPEYADKEELERLQTHTAQWGGKVVCDTEEAGMLVEF
jgi:L-ascorbate metabolism protein UlaG (beta-lactamase superfamily)